MRSHSRRPRKASRCEYPLPVEYGDRGRARNHRAFERRHLQAGDCSVARLARGFAWWFLFGDDVIGPPLTLGPSVRPRAKNDDTATQKSLASCVAIHWFARTGARNAEVPCVFAGRTAVGGQTGNSGLASTARVGGRSAGSGL